MNKESKAPLKAHVFICTKSRDDKPSCAGRLSEDFFLKLKEWAKKNGWDDQVKVSKTSCLQYCEKGIASCVYPQGAFYTDLQLTEIEKFQEEIKKLASI